MEYRDTSGIAGVFLLLAAAAWFASSPGISIALVYYGAALVSQRLYTMWHSSNARLLRAAGLVGLVLAWLAAVAFSAAVLPSNLSTALI